MHILLIFFSGTGVTKLYSHLIKQELKTAGHSVQLQDITGYNQRKSTILGSIKDYDGIVFGFPTYGSQIPSVCKNWLLEQKISKRMSGGVFFTYGGRAVGNIHKDTIQILEKIPISIQVSAEFLGPHTFNVAGWDLMIDRPNTEDRNTVKQFAHHLMSSFKNPRIKKIDCSNSEQGDRPRQHSGKIRWHLLYPSRTTKSCQMCKLCEINCPTKAFDANSGTVNKKTCIKCMKCVTSCLDNVITVPKLEEDYNNFLDKFNLTEKNRELKKSLIFY